MAKTINAILNLKDQFSGKMKQAGQLTNQQSKQMKLLGNNVAAFRKTAVSGFAEVAKKAGGLAIAFAGVQAAAETIKNGTEFMKSYQSSMANLGLATGATAEEMTNMKSSIMDMYKANMGESWSDLSNAMLTAKQVTGQAGDALKETTKMAVTYRDVFGEDIAASVKTTDTMMKNFGITSNQAYNLLAQGAQKGLNKSGELLDTANEYSTYFSKLGFTANDMFDIFSSGLEAGAFNLDKVGDGIKEFGIRTKDGSKSSMEAYKAIGLDGQKMTKQFAAGGQEAQKAFLATVKAINSLEDPFQKNAASVQLFGTQAEDLESRVISAYGNIKKQFDMTKNTMDGINKVKYSNTTDAFKGIGRLIETNIMIPIADKVLPKLNAVGQWITDNGPQIEAGINKAFQVGGEIISGFADSLGWAKDNADWLIPVIGGLTGAIVAQQIIGKIIPLYKTWTAATKGMTIAQVAFNIASKASPFGWIAAGIGLVIGLGILLWKNWDTVTEMAKKLWGSLTNIWGGIKDSIMSAVSGIAGWLGSFPFLGQAFLQTVTGIIDGVKQVFGGVIQFFKGVFTGDWERAWGGIVDVFRGTFGMISSYAKAPLNAVIGLINTVIEKINGISIDIPEWVPGFGGDKFGINIPKIPQFALGTAYAPGGPALINERGGEIRQTSRGETIIPADKSEKIVDRMTAGGGDVYVTIQGNVIGDEDFAHRMGRIIVGHIQMAQTNV